jgi:hypothetical protein
LGLQRLKTWMLMAPLTSANSQVGVDGFNKDEDDLLDL